MNNNTTSQYMDKQIMDLSNSQTTIAGNNNSGNTEFIDFMNRPSEKKDGIVPSYDFVPIRPAFGSSSPPELTRSSNLDSGDDDARIRTWNSLDSKTNSSSIRNYSSLDVDEPAKYVLGKNSKATSASLNVSLVSEIDKTVKKYTNNLMHAMDGVSARLSQLETRTRNLENSTDDLKVSIGNNHGSSDGKMRQMENILREVQTGVQSVRDKQDILEAQLQTAKLQFPKAEQQLETQKNTTKNTDFTQPGASTYQQFSNLSLTPPPQTLPPPNAPPPQQNLIPHVPFPDQFPRNQIPPTQQHEPYFTPPDQIQENSNQQYQQIPPPLPPQHQPPPPLQHPNQPPLQQQYAQPPPPPQPQHPNQPPPQQQYAQPPPPPLQPHPSFSLVNSSAPQTPDETPYTQHQTLRPPPPSHHPYAGVPPSPSQQFYGPTPNTYEPSSNRPGPGYPSSFGEPYPYSSSPSQYGSGSPRTGSSGGYPQLPTARILPQAIPTASGVSGGSGSGSSGSDNKVPIDDVVDKVTNMGFSRDQVRATVRKLTENGQSVDLNIVLDKLMNDGETQAPRGGWFGR